MNLISSIIKNLKILFPYFFLILIYFFFINLEAKHDLSEKDFIDEKKELNIENKHQNKVKDKIDGRITIEVIPYDG